ncbi:MAG: hypothetical protein LBD78_03190 [Spirochaetaceae bacterium]|jgi:IS30 family transposase|nr:hypothetical protein [Spirochaetaceae bacterium]
MLDRVSIDKRPKIVDKKSPAGDWEDDTIESAGKNAYHSWKRGLNEHTNGLIRQYLPKKIPFDGLTQKQPLENYSISYYYYNVVKGE